MNVLIILFLLRAYPRYKCLKKGCSKSFVCTFLTFGMSLEMIIPKFLGTKKVHIQMCALFRFLTYK